MKKFITKKKHLSFFVFNFVLLKTLLKFPKNREISRICTKKTNKFKKNPNLFVEGGKEKKNLHDCNGQVLPCLWHCP